MKIAISTLSGISYGGRTYFNNLIPALAKVDKYNEYHIFTHEGSDLSETINQGNFFFHVYSSKLNSALTRLFREQLILPIELKINKIDIMFTAKNANIILAPCKTIISIRNMEPLCYKNYQNHWILNVFSWLRRNYTLISIKSADRIIAVSQSVKNYLEKLCPGINDKVNVIYNGNPVAEESLNKNADGDRTPFMLSASKFVAYANQLNLIEGYAGLYEKNKELPPLWLAGGIHDKIYFEKIQKIITKRNLTDKIKILGLVPHGHLIELYSQAHAFIFPSTLEACPQTLIEAMACGVPIASSNVPPMPEICETAAIYFDPFDTNDIADKIDSIFFDERLREHLRKTALERSRFFDWEKTAVDLVKVFEIVHQDNP
ncbi:MAG: glycosyltransferase family 4 protein [Sedimentisphaerales bacterium]|nr:glycosyltransferase family 4 protein [Sedimentisphaerales bacterium]